MSLKIGDIEVLILQMNRYFDAFASKNWNGVSVIKTQEDLLEQLATVIIPYFESKISRVTTEAISKDLQEELQELHGLYAKSAYQYAFILSRIPDQKETYLKYLRIATEGNHSQKRHCQYYFAKEMEVTDPALSLNYYEKAVHAGYQVATFRLGELWEAGSAVVGGQSSLEKAVEFYQLAGVRGHQEGASRALKCIKAKEAAEEKEMASA
ncbi:hypothetical protein BDR26DRAFT_902327 [Obelidium mucronatum]|nr:hypothetical protein BDR26DRAFT_902327 [Obelidium mucronatum]